MAVGTTEVDAPLRQEPDPGTRMLSTPTFDWIFLVLIVLVEVGFGLDAWSHSTYGPDQSVLSEYHLLMYGAVGVLSAYLTYLGGMRIRNGVPWRDALPAGYIIGYLGLLAFGVSGGADLIGHALFGFEAGIEARMSPSHQGLFVGLTLLRLALPLAAGARQRAGIRGRWVDHIPSMISVGLLFQLLNLLVPGSALGGGGREWPTQEARGVGDFLAYNSGLGAIVVLTVLYVGLLVGVLRHVRLPLGAITVITLITPLLDSLDNGSLEFLPVWLAAGVVGDLFLLGARRWVGEIWALRLFGLVVPLVLWGGYFLTMIVTDHGGGVWWSGYIWTGTVVQAAAAGLMIATLATLSGKAPVEGEAR